MGVFTLTGLPYHLYVFIRLVLCIIAIFLIRDDSYIDTLPDEHRPVFVDENPMAPAKIKVLKGMIEDRFPVSCKTKKVN